MFDDCALFNILEFAAGGHFFLARVCKRWRQMLDKANPGGYTSSRDILSFEQNQAFYESHPDWLPGMLRQGVVSKNQSLVKYALTKGAMPSTDYYISACGRLPIDLNIIKVLYPYLKREQLSFYYLQCQLALEGDLDKLIQTQVMFNFAWDLHAIGRNAVISGSWTLIEWWFARAEKDEHRTSLLSAALKVVIEENCNDVADWLFERGGDQVLTPRHLECATLGGNIPWMTRLYDRPHKPTFIDQTYLAFHLGIPNWREVIDWQKERGRMEFPGLCYERATMGLTVKTLEYLEKVGVPRGMDETNGNLIIACIKSSKRSDADMIDILAWCVRDGLPEEVDGGKESWYERIHKSAAKRGDRQRVLEWVYNHYPSQKAHITTSKHLTISLVKFYKARKIDIPANILSAVTPSERPRLYHVIRALEKSQI